MLLLFEVAFELGRVVHPCNPNSLEVKAGGGRLRAQGFNVILSYKASLRLA